jgi:hypothetical protein
MNIVYEYIGSIATEVPLIAFPKLEDALQYVVDWHPKPLHVRPLEADDFEATIKNADMMMQRFLSSWQEFAARELAKQ